MGADKMIKKMPRIERQLRLYECICRYPIAQFPDICREVHPYHVRQLQRDLADLKDAGLVVVTYSRKGKGYVKTGIPEFNEDAKPRKRAHLARLGRLGILMGQLENEDVPRWEKKENEDGNPREYLTAKNSYNQLFPGLSERTRQRDFEVLRNIGFGVDYDRYDHCFTLDDGFGLAWLDVPEKIDEDYLEGAW